LPNDDCIFAQTDVEPLPPLAVRDSGDLDLLVLESLELERELEEAEEDLEAPDLDSLELEHESLERDLCRFLLLLLLVVLLLAWIELLPPALFTPLLNEFRWLLPPCGPLEPPLPPPKEWWEDDKGKLPDDDVRWCDAGWSNELVRPLTDLPVVRSNLSLEYWSRVRPLSFQEL